MKIDIFRVKKMSVESDGKISDENISEEYVTTVDMEVVPRAGETIYFYKHVDQGIDLFGIGAVKRINFTVEKVVYFVSDGRSSSINCISPHTTVTLFIS